MAAIAFDTLKYARKLIAAGVPEQQAEAQTEIMAEAFLINTDALVTKDYLDARLDARFVELEGRLDVSFAEIDAKFRLQNWILAVVMASTVIPAFHELFS